MNKKEIIYILKMLSKCPIKGWYDTDLGEDATQKDVWEEQAEWIENEWSKDYFTNL